MKTVIEDSMGPVLVVGPSSEEPEHDVVIQDSGGRWVPIHKEQVEDLVGALIGVVRPYDTVNPQKDFDENTR